MDTQKLIEAHQLKLANRQNALKATLDEISFFEAQPQEALIIRAIKELKVKRDRQEQAVRNTESLIKHLQGAKPRK